MAAMGVLAELRGLNTRLLSACLFGLVLSYYAYFVEIKKEEDEFYKPLCDIHKYVSCTKAFMSEYGKGLGLIPKDSILYARNPIYGLGVYILIVILTLTNNYACSAAVVILGFFCNVATIYLAYILYIIQDFCIVCFMTYIVNAIILSLSIKKFQKLLIGGTRKKK